MLRGLTSAGLGEIKSNRQLIELASANRFQTVDLSAYSLINELGEEKAKALLLEQKITIASISLPVEWRRDEETFLNDLSKLADHAAAAAKLGCSRCCTYILPSTDYKAAHFMTIATRRLKVCANLLRAYGIRLGLEFVGPHHLRTQWKNPFIWSMDETLDWINAIAEPNVGLLLDAFHWYTCQHSIAELEQLTANQIVHVHLNDAPDLPVNEVLDNERLYPGEGVIDLISFLRVLRKLGYTGSVTQEVLTSSQPTKTAELLADHSGKAFDQLFEKAGI